MSAWTVLAVAAATRPLVLLTLVPQVFTMIGATLQLPDARRALALARR